MRKIITICFAVAFSSAMAEQWKRPLLSKLLEKAEDSYVSPLLNYEAEPAEPKVNVVSVLQQLWFSDKQEQAIRLDMNRLIVGIKEAEITRNIAQQQLQQHRYKLSRILRRVRKLQQYSAPLVMLTSKKQGDFVATMVLLRSIIPQTYAQLRDFGDAVNSATAKADWQGKKLNKLRRVLAEVQIDGQNIADNLTKLCHGQQHELIASSPPTDWLLPIFNVHEFDAAQVTNSERQSKQLFSCQSGAAVYAPCSGKILYCANLGQLGRTVFIKHANSLLAISGLGKLEFQTGDKVNIGQVIGNMPSSNNDDMHFLYYEVWRHES